MGDYSLQVIFLYQVYMVMNKDKRCDKYPNEIFLYINHCMFDTPSQIAVKKANYEKSKITKAPSLFYITLGGEIRKILNIS